MATAERLFAEHGVAAVSSRQISEAAGQGNNAAVGYHFGTKTDLIRAIVRRHDEVIEHARRELVERIDQGGGRGGDRRGGGDGSGSGGGDGGQCGVRGDGRSGDGSGSGDGGQRGERSGGDGEGGGGQRGERSGSDSGSGGERGGGERSGGGSGDDGLRPWVECLVLPLTGHLAAVGRTSWYARFSLQVSTDPVLREIITDDVLGAPSLARIVRGLLPRLSELPDAVREERLEMVRSLIMHACADRERTLAASGEPPKPAWSRTATLLVDAITGLLQAPVSTPALP